jgi:hypothetical protein
MTADNDSERARLDQLLGELSPGGLSTTVANGKTVAHVLVHMAFWDEYCAALLEQWRESEVSASRSNYEAINAALAPLASAVAADRVAVLARAAADRVDAAVASLDPETVDRIVVLGLESVIRRARHRRLHLDQIEEALRGSQA